MSKLKISFHTFFLKLAAVPAKMDNISLGASTVRTGSRGFEVRFCAAEHAVAGGRGCGGIPVPILGERVPLHAARMIVREIFRAQTRMLPKAKKGGDLVLGSVLSNTDIRESRDRIVHPYVWVVGACCLCYVPLCTRCI